MSLQVPVYNLAGEKVGNQNLKPAVFGIPFSDAIVHQVVIAQEASSRQVLAHTKDRGEVRGGGKKPWRQKGTGRARHGSRRSPLWIGGGITFGPRKNRNFSKKVNKSMKHKAVCMVLSDKVKHERLVVIDAWDLKEAKTKKIDAAFKSLPSLHKKTAIITEPTDVLIIRASRNLPYITRLGVGSINTVDLLKNEYIIIPKKVLSIIEQRYS